MSLKVKSNATIGAFKCQHLRTHYSPHHYLIANWNHFITKSENRPPPIMKLIGLNTFCESLVYKHIERARKPYMDQDT